MSSNYESTTSFNILISSLILIHISAIVDMSYSEILFYSVTKVSLNIAPVGVEISSDDFCTLSFTSDIKSHYLSHNYLLTTLRDSVIVAFPTLVLISASQVSDKTIAFLQKC